MITPNYMTHAVVRGPDNSAMTDPTTIVRQSRRSMAMMIQSDFDRELMEFRVGGPNSLLQAIPPRIDILA